MAPKVAQDCPHYLPNTELKPAALIMTPSCSINTLLYIYSADHDRNTIRNWLTPLVYYGLRY